MIVLKEDSHINLSNTSAGAYMFLDLQAVLNAPFVLQVAESNATPVTGCVGEKGNGWGIPFWTEIS